MQQVEDSRKSEVSTDDLQVKASKGENPIRASESLSKDSSAKDPNKEQGNKQPSEAWAEEKAKSDSCSRDQKHRDKDKEKEKRKHHHHHHRHQHRRHGHRHSPSRSRSRHHHSRRHYSGSSEESSSPSRSYSSSSRSRSRSRSSSAKPRRQEQPAKDTSLTKDSVAPSVALAEEQRRAPTNFTPAPEPAPQRPTTILQNKHERQLYVGNLPPGLNGAQVVDLLNRALIKMNAMIEPGEPVVNAWVSSEGRFAFVEFRCPEEAQKALVLSNVSLMGYPIKVGKSRMTGEDRPRHGSPASTRVVGTKVGNILLPYIPRPAGPATPPRTVGEMTAQISGYKTLEKLQVSNLPLQYGKEEITKLMSIFGKVANVDLIIDPKLKKFNGQCFVEYGTDLELQKAATGAMGLRLGENVLETKKVPVSQTSETVAMNVLMQSTMTQLASNPDMAAHLIGISPNLKNLLESHPSRVVKLKNLVNVAELFDNTYYEDLMEDVQAEAQKHGQLSAVEIPKPTIMSGSVPGLGFVFIEYQTVEQAMSARRVLNGLKFSGKVVEAVFYPEDSFKKRIFDL